MIEKDPEELFDSYLEENLGNRFEGTEGVKRLEILCSELGYKYGQFLNASPILNFLADNPYAIQNIIDGIRDYISEESNGWAENLNLYAYTMEDDA